MKSIKLLFAALFILITNVLHAASPPKVQQFINHKDWNFVENKGQLSPSDIKYYGHQGGVYLYCKPGILSFVFTKTGSKESGQISEATGSGIVSPFGGGRGRNFERESGKTISTSRTDLILLNSNPNAQIAASDQQEYYENYYTTGDADHGITNVHTYKTVTYKNIYPNIDFILHSREEGMEYSFIVHPGGKVGDIQIQWNGTEASKALANGGFKFSNSLGTIKESAPKSFAGGKMVESSFEKKGFKVGNYDERKDLLIDPTLLWGTYYGGSAADAAQGLAVDGSGNAYITGYTVSTNGIATSGAYQTSLITTSSGVEDAFLAKFNNSGSLQWATYYGGGREEGFGVAVDGSGNAYITGTTVSTANIATNGAYQTSLAGSDDAFLAKFSSSGSLQWATYYGGVGNEDGYGVSIDGSGNAYLTGFTSSTSGIATVGAYQTSYSGNEDAFLVKFNNSGKLQWATYYGGNSQDVSRSVSTDGSGNVYISGYTESTSGIATSGAYLTSLPGLENVFLVKFNSSGSLQWATYYGGSIGDYAYGIATDGSGNVYITGGTGSTNGIATIGAYQTSLTGGENAFLVKFNSSGYRQWGTYYGGKTRDEGIGVAIDGYGNAYIAGSTTSGSGIATSGAYKTSNSGNGDAFLAKFSNTGSLQWATYYGGNLEDDGGGVATDGSGNAYIAGYIKSNGIATSGAYQTSNGGIADAFLAKFQLSGTDAGVASVNSPSGTFCSGIDTVKVILQNFGTSILTKVNINWSVNKSLQKSYSWTGSLKPDSTIALAIGAYNFLSPTDTIRAWTSLPNSIIDSFPQDDSARIVDNVNSLPAAAVISNTAICSGASISIGAAAVTGSSYSWSGSISGISSTVSNPSVSPTSTISYTLTETNSKGCVNSNSDTITVNTLPAATVIANTAICTGNAISIGASSVTGSSYSWSSSVSGYSSTTSNPSVSPTSTATYTLTETNVNGCLNSNSVTITVNPLPVVGIISNSTICSGNTISIGASAVSGSSYSWSGSVSGFSSTNSNPSVSPGSTATYTLVETNTKGCVNSNSVAIIVNALPAAAVISNTAICSGASISIGASAVAGSTYSWVSSSSGFSSSLPNPSVSPSSTTSYTLTETNSNGCSKSDSVTITVNPLPVPSVISSTSICVGSSISIGVTAVSGMNYSWLSTPSGFNSTVSNPNVKPTGTTTYYLTETNSTTGCSGSNSVTITVNPVPKSKFSFLNVCPGDSTPFTDSSTLVSNYYWYFGDGGTSSQTSPKHLYTSIGNYVVSLKVTSSRGCSDSISEKLSLSNCVWPGDANGDKVVDMNDLLAIGIAYGTVGHPRPNASITWTGQPSPDWDSSFSSGVNYKNADCNGDSVVNYKDTVAISTNYGLSHSKSGVVNQGSPSDPIFTIKYLKDTFYAGDTLIAQIIIGSALKPVVNLYGLAFSLALDPSIFETDKAILKINPSFLGINGTTLIDMTKNNTSSGTLDIGICRIDQLNASGNGTIATLYLPVKVSLSQKYIKASLSLSNNYQISYDQKPVSLYLSSDTVLVKQDHTGIDNLKTIGTISLSIFPNPFQSITTIAYNLNRNSRINIILTDITGKQIGTIVNDNQVPGDYQFDINAEKYHLSPGIYLMKFMMDDEVVSRRLVKF